MLGGRIGQPREAEVGDLRLAVLVHQHVHRLDVAMHHALRVRVVERFADLRRDVQCPRRRKPRAMDHLRQVRAIHILHHDVKMPLGRLPKIMHRDDVRVAELRQRPRFAHEAIGEIRVGADFDRQQFDGDLAVQRRLHGEIDRAHAAAPEEGEHIVIWQQPRDFLRCRRRPATRFPAIGSGRFGGMMGVRHREGLVTAC